MLDLYKTKRKRAAIEVRKGREICNLKTADGLREYRRRTELMAERQNYSCALCGRYMTRQDTTFDHQAGRGFGGAWRDDRIEIDGHPHNAAVHESCNGRKGSKRYHWKDGKYVPMSTGDEA